ncbi:hypothetical protein SUDANB121_05647 [Nocardiopsis dassonvillei]|uniref:hypothetical protein n=1 Tax=Nocardiopsis dassonvillei TaxID=2014 RepID=UPI003F547FB3
MLRSIGSAGDRLLSRLAPCTTASAGYRRYRYAPASSPCVRRYCCDVPGSGGTDGGRFGSVPAPLPRPPVFGRLTAPGDRMPARPAPAASAVGGCGHLSGASGPVGLTRRTGARSAARPRRSG